MFIKSLKLIPLLWFLTACVTINIYFPAAQAEQAADQIIDNILGADSQQPKIKKPVDDKQSAIETDQTLTMSIVDFFFPAAHAAGAPNFSIDTPQIRKLEAQMKSRHAKLAPFYKSGAIGYNNKGLVSVHNAKAISLRDKNKLNKLIASENADRNAMYKAIAQANGHPEWEAQVRDVFTKKWTQKAARGWWYQDSRGQWKKR